MSALHFTDGNFEKEVLKSTEPVLVDFWASWCGPCQVMGPVIEELASEYAGKGAKVGKMNVDEESATPQKYNVMSIPTLVIFKNGKPMDQMIGVQKKEDIKKRLDGLLK